MSSTEHPSSLTIAAAIVAYAAEHNLPAPRSIETSTEYGTATLQFAAHKEAAAWAWHVTNPAANDLCVAAPDRGRWSTYVVGDIAGIRVSVFCWTPMSEAEIRAAFAAERDMIGGRP